MKLIKTIAEKSLQLNCPECDSIIYQCRDCQKYFEPGESVYCGADPHNDYHRYHLCQSCGEDK